MPPASEGKEAGKAGADVAAGEQQLQYARRRAIASMLRELSPEALARTAEGAR